MEIRSRQYVQAFIQKHLPEVPTIPRSVTLSSGHVGIVHTHLFKQREDGTFLEYTFRYQSTNPVLPRYR